MKMFTTITIVLMMAALPLFGSGNKETTPSGTMDGGAMDGGAMEKHDDGMREGEAGFLRFTTIEDAMMKAESKPTVLFFEASWCPSCQQARSNFEANQEKLKDIYLISVDYDHSADLQVKYGVTYQHTFVQISSSGEALTKWNGGTTDDVLMNIVKGEM
jgi:thiol-disulfide isomerase/thioredoxin